MAEDKNVVQDDHIVKSAGFSAFCSKGTSNAVRTYSRKDFYKVCLYEGEAIIEYADKGIKINGHTLFFGTPHIPYAWEDINKKQAYTCLFTEGFLKVNNNSESLQQSPLFKIGGTPIFSLSDAQSKPICDIYKKLIADYNTDYVYKDDLIRNYINLIIHESLKLQPAINYVKPNNASQRVASLFLELLERQFPIEDQRNPLRLTTAKFYANGLSVHVNHLNRAVKEVTGKSTSTIIAERIITEAKALLKHSDWSISEIAYSLGFEYPTYFNNYFKRLTGTTPTAFRR